MTFTNDVTYPENNFLRSTERTVNWLKKAADADELELRPPFQRNLVWTEDQQSFLIDTILHGYPIPELYMQETVDADGNEQHVVVDGQQRITASLRFLEGELPLTGKYVTQHWLDLTFEDLTPELKKRVRGYQFVVRVLPEMADEELSLIFQRLNRSVRSLNQQELRHATYWGEFISSVEGLADYDFWEDSGLFTANDFRRMLDIEFISELYVAYLHGLPNKKEGLDKWYEVYEEEFNERDRVEEVFLDVMRELQAVLPQIRSSRWKKKSDFYSLFLTFCDHHHQLPLTRGGRKSAHEKLTRFSNLVDEYLSKARPPDKRFPKYVASYAEAVGRAATDRANRVARQKALEQLLQPVWSK